MSYTFRGFTIPEYMMGGLTRYIEQGIEPGDFLMAVLENNLRQAVGQADDENIVNLPAYIGYLYNEAPGSCWGSPAKVQAWMDELAAKNEKRREAQLEAGDLLGQQL